MLLKNRSELLFPLSRQKIPIVFEIQSSEPINYSEIKCQITLHLNFFREWAGFFAKSFYLRDPCKPPFWEQFSSFATSSITFSFLFHWFDIAPQNDIYLPKYVVHNGRTVAIKFKITLKIKWSIHYTWFCRCWGEVDLYCLSVPSDFSPCRCTPYSCKHLTFA